MDRRINSGCFVVCGGRKRSFLRTALFCTIGFVLVSFVKYNEKASNFNDWRSSRHLLQSEAEPDVTALSPTEQLEEHSPKHHHTTTKSIDERPSLETAREEKEVTIVPTEATAEEPGNKQADGERLEVSSTTHPWRRPKTVETDEGNITCQPPAYHEFPPDMFTNRERKNGAVLFHILVGFYMFYGLAVVCDGYFVASLEKICEKAGLSEDVAGATFMAAGSSAPELFASILGVFVAKGDVGTGTIVGSAVFNILGVVGICAFFAGQPVMLTWWPLVRDCTSYGITVVVLLIVMADSEVQWYESVTMLCLYSLYIILMKYNYQVMEFLVHNTPLKKMDAITLASQSLITQAPTEDRFYNSYVQFTSKQQPDPTVNGTFIENASTNLEENPLAKPADEIIKDNPKRRMSLYEAFLRMMYTKRFRPITRFRMAAYRIMLENKRNRELRHDAAKVLADLTGKPVGLGFEEDVADSWKRKPSLDNDGPVAVVIWYVTTPLLVMMAYTIPNCKHAKWEGYYGLTFLASMLWIAIFSYILVWMVALAGYTMGVPDTIMGITFLAAGTSVPDAMSSLIVARQGQGDMAVSNSIGSNVFDVLIGLAFPWFLQTCVVYPGSVVMINSGGMVWNVLLLFLSIAAVVYLIHRAHWYLTSSLGINLIVVYAIFLVFSILIEFNVFGFVNPPECEE